MKKSTEDMNNRRLEALRQEFPMSTDERLNTLLYRYNKGKSGPVMKRIHQLFRKRGLE